MALVDLTDWLDEQTAPDALWYLKRLSGNDTLANGSHQAGPYVPKPVLFEGLPHLNRPDEENPDVHVSLCIDSHADGREVRAVWYNKRLHKTGTRDEARLTGFGGSSSALLDPESTGALTAIVFRTGGNSESEIRVWVCQNSAEEELIEDRVGPIEPSQWIAWRPVGSASAQPTLFDNVAPALSSCWLTPEQMPSGWLINFPTGQEIINKTVEIGSYDTLDVDERLIRRRDCEFELFRSVEEAIELPNIKAGFTNLEDFLKRAQTILQRRKARSGRSLELHVRHILNEENFEAGRTYSHQPESEPGKKPDFLFPSQEAYRNPAFPAHQLRMLGVKTTCKDRWRQIIPEADRIEEKHLLTLQEGVSENQFREMTDQKVRLVVPSGLHDSYPEAVRSHLISLESFIGDVRLLSLSHGPSSPASSQ